MLTPIQQAIKEIDTWAKLDALKKGDPYDRGFVSGINRAIDVLRHELPKEKEVIEDAFTAGHIATISDNGHIKNKEDYYNKTFNQ
jgi:hypothetical protein